MGVLFMLTGVIFRLTKVPPKVREDDILEGFCGRKTYGTILKCFAHTWNSKNTAIIVIAVSPMPTNVKL